MRGVYTATVVNFAYTASKTILYMDCPATAAIEILRVTVTNVSNETNEQQEVQLAHVNAKGTPADSSVVVIGRAEQSDAASLLVDATNLLGNLTTEPTSYFDPVVKQGFASLTGFLWEPTPETRIVVGPSKAFGVKMLQSAASFNLDVEVTWREFA